MKERPLLMTPENAQKCFEGVKTQTRRIIKPQPNIVHAWDGEWLVTNQIFCNNSPGLRCPYGLVGDRLWVKHVTWKPKHIGDIRNDQRWNPIAHEIIWRIGETVSDVTGVDENFWIKVNGMFMPRWACRTVVEITEIRVQRVQEISEEDARAEGIQYVPGHEGKYFERFDSKHPKDSCIKDGCRSAVTSFMTLWQSINGPDSWDANPWVWCLSYKKVIA